MRALPGADRPKAEDFFFWEGAGAAAAGTDEGVDEGFGGALEDDVGGAAGASGVTPTAVWIRLGGMPPSAERSQSNALKPWRNNNIPTNESPQVFLAESMSSWEISPGRSSLIMLNAPFMQFEQRMSVESPAWRAPATWRMLSELMLNVPVMPSSPVSV